MSGERGQRREVIELLVRDSGDFLVDAEDGTEVGVVDRVLFDEASRVTQIEVGCGWFGRRRLTLDLGDVVAVSPSRRLLVVSNESVARGD
jgi:hypothetical protein